MDKHKTNEFIVAYGTLFTTVLRDADDALSRAILYLITGSNHYRSNTCPEGNDAAPFGQKSPSHTLSIQGENCTWTCDKAEAVFGDLINVHVTVAEGYTLRGATVTVNGVKQMFGMPQEDAVVIITPVKK